MIYSVRRSPIRVIVGVVGKSRFLHPVSRRCNGVLHSDQADMIGLEPDLEHHLARAQLRASGCSVRRNGNTTQHLGGLSSYEYIIHLDSVKVWKVETPRRSPRPMHSDSRPRACKASSRAAILGLVLA
jgi:hypothetical protein